jgi:iron complex outermembrane receptor protein
LGNLLARWRHALSASSDLRLQVYYDRTERQGTAFRELRETADIDFQHCFLLHKRHEIIWGLGYCLRVDDTSGSFAISLNPTKPYRPPPTILTTSFTCAHG